MIPVTCNEFLGSVGLELGSVNDLTTKLLNHSTRAGLGDSMNSHHNIRASHSKYSDCRTPNGRPGSGQTCAQRFCKPFAHTTCEHTPAGSGS